MKKYTLSALILALFTSACLFGQELSLPVEEEIVTLTGEAQCAKCTLKMQDKCQTVLVIPAAKEGEKPQIVYTRGDGGFHSQVCRAGTKLAAKFTGVVTETEDGKTLMVQPKIELVKN